MRIVEFENWHLEFLIKMYPDDFIKNFHDGLPDIENHFIYTLFDEGRIIAVGGALLHPWPGLGEMFFYKSPFYDDHVLAYSRAISKLVDIIQEKGSFHRLQANVSKEDHCAIRFIEFLKFNIEGVLSTYGPNKEDHIQYARIERSS